MSQTFSNAFRTSKYFPYRTKSFDYKSSYRIRKHEHIDFLIFTRATLRHFQITIGLKLRGSNSLADSKIPIKSQDVTNTIFWLS